MMNKIPIKTNTPISTWDRKLSEITLMSQTLNETNINETKGYLLLMYSASQRFLLGERNLENIFLEAQNYFRNKNYGAAHSNIYYIILKSFPQSNIMKKSLKLRGDIFMRQGLYERAVDNYELCLSLYQENEYSCELLGAITEGFISLGYYQEAKYYLNILGDLYKQHEKLLNTNGAIHNTVFHSRCGKEKYQKIEFCEQMKNILSGLQNALKDIPVRRTRKYFEYNHNFIPFNGYTTNWKIMHASVACTLIETPRSSKMVANRFIPKYNVVALEKPAALQLYTPNLQCEECLQESDIYLPCLFCKIKMYCSTHCRKKDRIHMYECAGYNITLLPVLDAQLLYKTFVKCLMYMQDNIFNQDVFGAIYTVHDLFETVIKLFENSKPTLLRRLIAVTPNYSKISQSEYATMVTVACRLSIFIAADTKIINDFFHNLKTTFEDNQIFIAALLLRLGANIAECTVEVSYEGSLLKNEYFPPEFTAAYYNRHVLGNVNISDKIDFDQYFKFNETNARLNAENFVESIINEDKGKNSTTNLNFDYVSLVHNRKIIREWVISTTKNCKSGLSLSEQKAFVYSTTEALRASLPFSSLSPNNIFRQTISGIYPTLKKFNHSCNPNVHIIYLSSGAIVAKAICDIKYGDELTIAYGTTYKGTTKDLRQAFLRHYSIDCKCKLCLSDAEPYLAHKSGYCYDCGALIHLNNGCCTGCGINRYNLVHRYENLYDIALSVDPQVLQNDVWQFRHNMVLFFMLVKLFPTNSYIIFKQKLKIVKLLAKNNFIYEAYDVLASIDYEPLRFCNSMSVTLFMTYYDILSILIYMLHYNIPTNIHFIHTHCKILFKIFKMAWNVAKFLLDVNDFHIMFNKLTFNLLTIIQQLMGMRLACYTLLALDGLDRDSFIAKYNNDKDDYIMPDLETI